MHAAVYKGQSVVAVEQIPTPEIGPGEMLIRVEACGICHTDLKKIEYNLLAPPRIYGHETAGVVAQRGRGRAPASRPAIAWSCSITSPAGLFLLPQEALRAVPGLQEGRRHGGLRAGGRRLFAIRAGDGLDRASAAWKRFPTAFPSSAPLRRAGEHLPESRGAVRARSPAKWWWLLGQGPIGLMFTMLVRAHGRARDRDRHHSERAGSFRRRCGAERGLRSAHRRMWRRRSRALTEGRGADLVIVAASAPGIVEQAIRCSRPGARILLFAQTSDTERIEVSGAASAWVSGRCSVATALRWICRRNPRTWCFSGALPVEELDFASASAG